MPKLPYDIIVDILSRLPVKSLMRFKCVCKPWCSLISDSQFAKLHLKRAKQDSNTNCSKILLTTFPHPFIIDYEASSIHGNCDNETISVLPYPVRNPDDDVEVVGSCDGLVCLVLDDENFIVWNPSTRVSRELPKPCSFPEGTTFSYGFGYDSSIDDYRVVRRINLKSADGTKESKVEVITLKSNVWRTIQNDHQPALGTILDGPGTILNGEVVLEEKLMEAVPLPDFIEDENIFSAGLGISGNSVFMYRDIRRTYFEVWVMKEFGGKASWSRLFRVPSETLPTGKYWQTPVCLTKNGKMVLDIDGEDLFMYDPEEETFKSFMINTDWDHVAVYLETLVSPNS